VHVLIVLGILIVGVVVLATLSAIGQRQVRPGVSNEDILRQVDALSAKVDGQLVGSTGVPYVTSSVGATGPAGPPTGSPTMTTYEAQGSGQLSLVGIAHGTVIMPTRRERFRRYFGIGGWRSPGDDSEPLS
jgi:hypothetical protein